MTSMRKPTLTMSAGPQQPQPQGNAIETLEPLLASWGVEIPSDSFVGDLTAATRVSGKASPRGSATPTLNRRRA
ncbi:MAG: hypothetical protein ACRBM6_16570 [Geminicoccales bacterium]